jgi:hypothetical protein
MTDVVLVRPRHGLILDGIPSKGAEVPRALAEEWIANRLVEPVHTPTPTPTPVPQKRRSTK